MRLPLPEAEPRSLHTLAGVVQEWLWGSGTDQLGTVVAVGGEGGIGGEVPLSIEGKAERTESICVCWRFFPDPKT